VVLESMLCQTLHLHVAINMQVIQMLESMLSQTLHLHVAINMQVIQSSD